MEENPPMSYVDVCNFFLQEFVFCLINRNSHTLQEPFLPFARKDS